MDVSAPQLTSHSRLARPGALFAIALAGVVLLALALRLQGIGDPLLDHPGWRQGDTAAIARNFARLNFNVMYPQTMYDGPPPNYVELELQIVPFAAATLYKVFGIHEIFGRLIAVAFALGTVVLLAYFARWLFASSLAGILAALFYAVYPGSVYYGRTFMPDGAMLFFLVAALYAAARLLLADDRIRPGSLALTAGLLSLAYLAKPVSVIGIVPVAGLMWERIHLRRPLRIAAAIVLLVVPLFVLWLYDRRVASYAEWHWSSGITQKHVLPALAAALVNAHALVIKLSQTGAALGMLRETMLGNAGFLLAIAGFVALPWVAARSRVVLWAWLVAGLFYLFAVVTVEHVDYYLYPLLPLCALVTGGAAARFIRIVRGDDIAPAPAFALSALVPIAAIIVLVSGRTAVAQYYEYSPQVYRNATLLGAALEPNAVVVIGHYGPDVQYYIDRFGWEEDPALWTPFDEESAIRKGARYFISIEDNRLRANMELCAWLARFPVQRLGQWPVYRTDPGARLAGAQRFWQAFRRADRVGDGRAFLDAHRLCIVKVR